MRLLIKMPQAKIAASLPSVKDLSEQFFATCQAATADIFPLKSAMDA